MAWAAVRLPGGQLHLGDGGLELGQVELNDVLSAGPALVPQAAVDRIGRVAGGGDGRLFIGIIGHETGGDDGGERTGGAAGPDVDDRGDGGVVGGDGGVAAAGRGGGGVTGRGHDGDVEAGLVGVFLGLDFGAIERGSG